jgi:hypothetical protein
MRNAAARVFETHAEASSFAPQTALAKSVAKLTLALASGNRIERPLSASLAAR